MKKFTFLLAGLFIILLFYPKSKITAQMALEFDGVDDIAAFTQVTQNITFAEERPYTIEFILQLNEKEGQQTILSQENSVGIFKIGLTEDFNLFTRVNEETYFFEEYAFEQEDCFHITLVYAVDDIKLYVNGALESSVNRTSYDVNEISTAFIFDIGYDVQLGSEYFAGVLDQLRIFTDQRTLGEIQTYLFAPLPINIDNRLAYLSFEYFMGLDYFKDIYNQAGLGFLGGQSLIGARKPAVIEASCTNFDEPDGIYAACQSLPACSTATLPANELLCNGDFEQYCSSLDGAQPTFSNQGLVFNYFSAPSPSITLQSDVVNWRQTVTTSDNNSNGFFVRGGVGMQPLQPLNSFTPYETVSTFFGTNGPLNAIIFSPQNTHGGNGNATASLMPGNWFDGNSTSGHSSWLATNMRTNLKPSTAYNVEVWVYVTAHWSWMLGNNHNLSTLVNDALDIDYQFSQSNGAAIFNFNGNLKSNVSTTPNIVSMPNPNNGWTKVGLTFTTPANLPANLDMFEIRASLPITNDEYRLLAFIDDVSVKEVVTNTSTWPQYISTGVNPSGTHHNDAWNKRIKVDNLDNVYVLQSLVNENIDVEHGIPAVTSLTLGNNKMGTLITKYSSSGALLWKKIYENMLLKDFEIDPSGNLIAVGRTEVQDSPKPIATYNGPAGQESNPNNWSLTLSNNTITTWSHIDFSNTSAGVSHTGDYYWGWNQSTVNPSTGSHTAPYSFTLRPQHTANVVIAEINASDGSLIGGSAKAYGGLANEEAIDIEIMNNKAYIAVRTLGTTVANNICANVPANGTCPLRATIPPTPIPPPTVYTNSWSFGNATGNFGQDIFRWNLNTNNKNDLVFTEPVDQTPLANYHNDFSIGMMDNDGTHLYVLMEGALFKYNSAGLKTSETYLPQAQQKGSFSPPVATQHPRYLHAAANGKLYISYRETTLDQHLLEQRATSDLSLLNSQTTSARPLSITSNLDDVYVSYWRLPSNSSIHETFAVDKYDAGNANNSNPFAPVNTVWQKEASHLDLDFPDFHAFGDVNTDMVFANNGSKLFFVNHFRSLDINWYIQFDQKMLLKSGVATSEQEVFISTLDDFGTSASFKKDPSLPRDTLAVEINDYSIYPNPSSRYTVIESNEVMESLLLIDLNGRVIMSFSNLNTTQKEIDIAHLAAGTYILRLAFKNKVINERLLKN
jgi:hypothetical protein